MIVMDSKRPGKRFGLRQRLPRHTVLSHQNVIRAVTHLHTSHSWDSALRPRRLVEVLASLEIDLALVTDHDTFAGSQETAQLAQGRVVVPTSAEIRTDRGDLIAIYEPGVTPPPVADLKEWDRAVALIRDTGGVVWLPHPFRSHLEPAELAKDVDIIEVFNARCSKRDDERATHLAQSLGIQRAFGSDAHRAREVESVVVEYDSGPDATVRSILMSPVDPLRTGRNPKSSKMVAEMVNGVKRGRPILTGYFLLKYVKHRFIEVVRG